MNINFQVITEKINELLSTPEAAKVTAGSGFTIASLNLFFKDYPIVHDTLSIIALILTCFLTYIMIRIGMVNLRIRQMDAREREIKLIKFELDSSKEKL